jgi:UDP-N-acetylmuramoyl-tripeptide--D-alanyl-D-alanine ligase
MGKDRFWARATRLRQTLPHLWFQLRDPLARHRLRVQALHRAYPTLAKLAGVYRRTVLRQVAVVAVVGSFGKTTTMAAVRSALADRSTGSVVGNRGFYVARALLTAHPRGQVTVIEAGIERPGEMERHALMLQPNVTVVTSIGSEHNRSFADLTVTRAEKAKMVAATNPGGLVVLNGDDPHVRWMEAAARCPVVTVGFDLQNHVRMANYQLHWPTGSSFQLEGIALEPIPVATRLMGRKMVYPAAAAVVVAHHLGIPVREALANLRNLVPCSARLQVVELSRGAYLVRDELKSAIETIEAALDLLEEVPAERKVVVLGDITEPPVPTGAAYRRVGRRVAEVADRVVLVARQGHKYRAGARQAGHDTQHWIMLGDNVPGSIPILCAMIRPGDVVLVKGRSTQRLARISLALMGRAVRCRVQFCQAVGDCVTCPRLVRG